MVFESINVFLFINKNVTRCPELLTLDTDSARPPPRRGPVGLPPPGAQEEAKCWPCCSSLSIAVDPTKCPHVPYSFLWGRGHWWPKCQLQVSPGGTTTSLERSLPRARGAFLSTGPCPVLQFGLLSSGIILEVLLFVEEKIFYLLLKPPVMFVCKL